MVSMMFWKCHLFKVVTDLIWLFIWDVFVLWAFHCPCIWKGIIYYFKWTVNSWKNSPSLDCQWTHVTTEPSPKTTLPLAILMPKRFGSTLHQEANLSYLTWTNSRWPCRGQKLSEDLGVEVEGVSHRLQTTWGTEEQTVKSSGSWRVTVSPDHHKRNEILS